MFVWGLDFRRVCRLIRVVFSNWYSECYGDVKLVGLGFEEEGKEGN